MYSASQTYSKIILVLFISILTLFSNSSLFLEKANTPQLYGFWLSSLLAITILSFRLNRSNTIYKPLSIGECLGFAYILYLVVQNLVLGVPVFHLVVTGYVIASLYLLLRGSRRPFSFPRLAAIMSIVTAAQSLYALCRWLFMGTPLPLIGSFDNPVLS